MIVKAQEERGADILKIVNIAESRREIPIYMEAIQEILTTTDKKLLLLAAAMDSF